MIAAEGRAVITLHQAEAVVENRARERELAGTNDMLLHCITEEVRSRRTADDQRAHASEVGLDNCAGLPVPVRKHHHAIADLEAEYGALLVCHVEQTR